MACPHCHSPTADSNDTFCRQCGGQLSQQANNILTDHAPGKPPTAASAARLPYVSPPHPAPICPIRIQAKCARVVANVPNTLTLHITNDQIHTCQLTITLEADLLGLREAYRMQLPGGDSDEVYSRPFTARIGAHVAQIEVQIDNEKYFGTYHLAFHELRPQAPVHITGPVLTKEAETIVGDDSLQMTVVLPDGSQHDADHFSPVTLRSQLAQRLLRKQITAPYRHHQLPEFCRRITLRAQHGDDAKRFMLVGGTSFVLGRQPNSCDLTLTCPRDASRSEMISRQHAHLQFDAEGIIWDDRSRNGTELRYPWGDEFIAEQRRRLPEQVGLSPGRVLPLELRCFPCPFSVLDLPAYREFASALGRPTELNTTGTYQAVRIQRQDLWSDQEYFLIQHSIAIGRGESAAIQHPESGPARSALIHFLGGLFWLEPFSPEVEVIVAHHELALHDLAPLLPGIHFRVGCVDFEVHEFRQETR